MGTTNRQALQECIEHRVQAILRQEFGSRADVGFAGVAIAQAALDEVARSMLANAIGDAE